MELHWTPLASPMRQLGGCSGAAQFRSSPHLPSSSCALPFVPLAGSLSPPPLAGRLTPAFNATGWKPELDAWTLLPLAGSLSWTPGPLLSWALLLKVVPAAGYKPHRPLSRAIPASPRYPPETWAWTFFPPLFSCISCGHPGLLAQDQIVPGPLLHTTA